MNRTPLTLVRNRGDEPTTTVERSADGRVAVTNITYQAR